MINNRKTFGSIVAATLMLAASSAMAGDKYTPQYEVTVTNLTKAVSFTPVLVASHSRGVSILELGEPASDELAALAEGGDIAPLSGVLQANHKVADINNSEGLVGPGASVSIMVSAPWSATHISLASMMIPTNDSFIALDSVKAPWFGRFEYYSPGYDAGSEPNDELCVSIPGPVCGGEGGSPGVGGEGYVHVNNGIQGIGDLSPAVYDWRNPVAKISIRRVR